ncbi:hypothetical protein [Halobacteriovorax sp. DPLXC-1]
MTQETKSVARVFRLYEKVFYSFSLRENIVLVCGCFPIAPETTKPA